MQYAHNRVDKRQSDGLPVVPSASGVVGGTTAVSVTLGSSLLLGPSASAVPSVSNALDPNDPVITVTDSSSHQTSSTTTPLVVPHRNSPISTGAVLGISAGVFVVAVAAMFAVYMHFKKRTDAQARRPLTRSSQPTSRVDGAKRGSGGDKWQLLEGSNKSTAGEVKPTTPEIGKLGLFEKDPSVRSVSDEKASNTFDPAAMPNFAQYHPNLAEEPSSVPPSRPFASGMASSPVVSWSGETVADSFLSLRSSGASGSMSPSAVMARQAPMTTDSALHRWESAEVLIMDDAVTERPSVYSENAQNPFRDDEDSRASLNENERDTRASSSNPFFNASQHNPFSDQSSRSRSRKSSISTVKHSRSNSVASRRTVRAGAGDNALLSLIAALDTKPVAPEDQSNRASLQTTATSIYTPVEGSATPLTPKAF